MNSKEFYDTVKAMREAQRKYFKYKSKTDLEASKRLEKLIDDEIARVEDKLNPKPKQLDLFNNN